MGWGCSRGMDATASMTSQLAESRSRRGPGPSWPTPSDVPALDISAKTSLKLSNRTRKERKKERKEKTQSCISSVQKTEGGKPRVKFLPVGIGIDQKIVRESRERRDRP
ncbi:hypothetical protein TNCV_1870881 [Trichonephila clavipes]|nr:hypothetical protein TNCV_1870881 [Trichonephila clavipes]